jgi:DNA-binding GntR family transcriptional regulator
MAEKRSDVIDIRDTTPSLGEYVYQQLLRALREGEFHPGERIREAEVSRRFDVSRTPVREALHRLQSEGRLKSEPQRGMVVAELDRQEVAELYALRQHLEAIAARFAAQHATEAEIEAMEYILEQAKHADDDIRELNQINWELHHAIYNAAHNRFLMQSFAAISDSMALLRGAKFIPENRPAELYEEHLSIIKAIKARDPDGADEAAQRHVRHAFRTHLESAFTARSSQRKGTSQS